MPSLLDGLVSLLAAIGLSSGTGLPNKIMPSDFEPVFITTGFSSEKVDVDDPVFLGDDDDLANGLAAVSGFHVDFIYMQNNDVLSQMCRVTISEIHK